jgi:hypothetical protein
MPIVLNQVTSLGMLRENLLHLMLEFLTQFSDYVSLSLGNEVKVFNKPPPEERLASAEMAWKQPQIL